MNSRIKDQRFSSPHFFRMTTLAIVAVTLGACSSMPDRNAALDEARSRFNLAQGDSRVAAFAPDELSRAGESLRVADKAWTDGNSPVIIDHLAYMTSQRVTIAQETASSKASQTIIANAGAERDRMRLESRTMEAESAKRDLNVSEQNSAMKSNQLANASASATATAAATALREQESAMRNAAAINDLQTQLSELNAKKTDRGMVVTLGDVLFATGDAKLLAAGSKSMVKLAEAFKSNPQRKATIEGYTDSVGSFQMNRQLSEARARTAWAALVELGVSPARLEARGYGSNYPIASNTTPAGRAMNRRLSVRVINK